MIITMSLYESIPSRRGITRLILQKPELVAASYINQLDTTFETMFSV